MRYVKYIVAGVAGVLLFWVMYGLQYLWWFPEGVFEAAMPHVVDAGFNAMKKQGKPVTDLPSLMAGVRDHYSTRKNFDFVGVYEVPGTGETVFITVQGIHPDNPAPTIGQREAFTAFINAYPGIKPEALRVGLAEYDKQRLMRKDMIEEIRKRPARPTEIRLALVVPPEIRLALVVPPEITMAQLQDPKTETWLTLSSFGDRVAILNYRIPGKATLSPMPLGVQVTIKNGEVVEPRGLFDDDDEDDDFFDQWDDDDDWE